MARFLFCLALILVTPLASAEGNPVYCPQQLWCPSNKVSDCVAQGQFAPYWNTPKEAGTSVIKGVYTFKSVWVKYAAGYAIENECFYVNTIISSSTSFYLSVSNTRKAVYFVTLPLSGLWKTVPNRSEEIKCESLDIFQCRLQMRANFMPDAAGTPKK